MSKYELLGYHHETPERSPGLDFLRIAMLVVSAGSFVAGEWLLGFTALSLALVTGHGIPHEVSHFRPSSGGIQW